MVLIVNGKQFSTGGMSEEDILKLAQDEIFIPCYVPGNFPWEGTGGL